jgi:hypothetical protein
VKEIRQKLVETSLAQIEEEERKALRDEIAGKLRREEPGRMIGGEKLQEKPGEFVAAPGEEPPAEQVHDQGADRPVDGVPSSEDAAGPAAGAGPAAESIGASPSAEAPQEGMTQEGRDGAAPAALESEGAPVLDFEERSATGGGGPPTLPPSRPLPPETREAIRSDYQNLVDHIEELSNSMGTVEALNSLSKTIALLSEEKKKRKDLNLSAEQTESLLNYLKRICNRLNISIDKFDESVRGLVPIINDAMNKLDEK